MKADIVKSMFRQIIYWGRGASDGGLNNQYRFPRSLCFPFPSKTPVVDSVTAGGLFNDTTGKTP